MMILCIEICFFFNLFISFYTYLFYCIHRNFLILFPVTLDMYFYLMNNKDMLLLLLLTGYPCF